MTQATGTMVRRRRTRVVALLAGVIALAAPPADACQRPLYEAAGKYASCDRRVFGKLYGGVSIDSVLRVLRKCRVTYAATWPKVAANYGGQDPLCSGERFLDNGNGTITDRLTGLQWERKTDDGSIHDKDDVYAWSAGITQADGSVFTSFLAALNGGSCFADHCDWRLPTREELQMLLSDVDPCTTPPCIDQDVFGPTAAAFHWSSTTNATGAGFAWGVQFATGTIGASPKSIDASVRAVRTGW